MPKIIDVISGLEKRDVLGRALGSTAYDGGHNSCANTKVVVDSSELFNVIFDAEVSFEKTNKIVSLATYTTNKLTQAIEQGKILKVRGK